MLRARRGSATAGLLLVLMVGAGVLSAVTKPARAVIPGGTNILHVPMSWCIVNGSPAAVSPNVTNEGTTMTDTNTNAVIWRRHERPTDGVYLPEASISLRSAIDSAWGTLIFPVIADPDTSHGLQGDVNSDPSSTEGTTLVNNCEATYASPAYGRAGVGITAINVNLWDDSAGNHTTQVGLGGCGYIIGETTCSYGFFIIVADNHYFYPTVPNRTIPGVGTLNADPLDLAVGHETGHALNLPHRTDTTALMNPTLADNDGDGRVDNKALNASEVTIARGSAARVNGVETDPAGQFVPGPVVEARLIDVPQKKTLPPHLNLAALSLMLDTKANSVQLVQRLWGLLPCRTLRPTTYAYLADLDNRKSTGASSTQLSRVGLPSRFAGADLVAKAVVVGSHRRGRDYRTCQTSVKAWTVVDGRLRALPRGVIDARIAVMRAWRQFGSLRKPQRAPKPLAFDLFNMIVFSVHNPPLPHPVKLNSPVRLSAFVLAGGKRVDTFGRGDKGDRFILQHPHFPHCFPAGIGRRGGTVKIRFDGMRPNRDIHALLGPNEVLHGVRSDARGGGVIQFPIPKQTRPGNHLVTIGHDGLALTADCTLVVR